MVEIHRCNGKSQRQIGQGSFVNSRTDVPWPPPCLNGIRVIASKTEGRMEHPLYIYHMTCVYECVKKGDEPLQNIVGNLRFSLICVLLKETVGC